MLNKDRIQSIPGVTTASLDYEPPRVDVIGDASTVILGVAGGGDDLFGYSRPEFEFADDGDPVVVNERGTNGLQD